MDIDAAYERLADERNATVDDLDKACAALKEAEQYSITVTSGNQNRLEAEADLFDQIIDYRGLSK